MCRVSPNLIIMPASPALVAELAPRDAVGAQMVSLVRSLVDATAAPIHLVASRDPRWETGVEGSFRAWGAPQVTVGEGRFLPELVQRYVLGEAASRVASVRGELGEVEPEALTLVAVDGSAGLTERAPLALLPQAAAADEWCRAVLSGRPAGELPADGGVLEPGLWHELAAREPQHAELLLADTTHGVGRYVAAWQI
ncbi:hypothetical protein SAMN06295981_0609 [Corynebacterium pollutisoli]|uniref:Uncharacterized protein n=1 Tax=Corynebacterium pollutisoli TaxID=1610489 RepID=A0A1X7IC98_9CORY|nr:hypothetical protein [Corynebacterium pollutisoli]SMG11758.1 hypothetical protein SAMN06295981_0609 [Corynebacterium pollutisoli]